jgi:hypothetical protein
MAEIEVPKIWKAMWKLDRFKSTGQALDSFYSYFLLMKGEIFLHGLTQDPWGQNLEPNYRPVSLQMAEIGVPKI